MSVNVFERLPISTNVCTISMTCASTTCTAYSISAPASRPPCVRARARIVRARVRDGLCGSMQHSWWQCAFVHKIFVWAREHTCRGVCQTRTRVRLCTCAVFVQTVHVHAKALGSLRRRAHARVCAQPDELPLRPGGGGGGSGPPRGK